MGKSSNQAMFDTAPALVPQTKKVKKGKRDSDEALDKRAIPQKEEIEVEYVALTKEKVKKMKKTLIEPPEEKKEDTKSSDFEEVVAAAPIVVSQMKASKKGKRGNDDDNDTKNRESSKKQKIEFEKVVPNNKKVKKLKNALIEPMGKMKDETCISDFEEEVHTSPISFPPMRKVKKGKSGSDEAWDKLPSSKKEKIEIEQVTLIKEKVKKLKIALIEPLGQKNEETNSSESEGELAATSIIVSQTKVAKKGKMRDEDETKKQTSSKNQKIDVEIGQSNKEVKKLKKALIEPTGKKKYETCNSDFGEEDTDKEIKNSLTGDAESKKSCRIFENEAEAPNNQDEKSHAKRLFVGNLSPEIIKDDLLEFFKEAGKVIEIQLHAKEDGSFRGFGHVEFATAADAQRALGKNYDLLLGRRVMIDYAVEKGSNNPPKGKTVQDSAHSCVYVKGFGKSLGEDQIRNYLKEHFGSCGEIIRVSIPQDNKTGRSKGFAYIMFNDEATVSKALKLNGTKLGSCILSVEQPTPKIGAPDGAYRGGRGNKGRSADQGWGRGRGGRGAGAPYNTGATAIKAKRTTFVDDD